jgi:C1A family cysteine protease
MSVGYIYGNRKTSDYKNEGMIMRDALEAVRKYGDVHKELFPYNEEVPYVIDLFERQSRSLFKEGYPNRISQYCRVDSPNAIKSALISGNPVLMAMTWYADMEVIDDILVTNQLGWEGGHCMFIYGWDERGWKVQNSWGSDWGNQGCMIVPYEYPIEEFWVINDNIIENTEVKKPFNSKVGKTIAKIVNKFNKIFKCKK